MAEWLPLVFTAGWASGLNSYLVVLLLGVGGRLGVEQVPPFVTDTRTMAVAGVLALLHVVADKVAYLDSAWDAVHTVVRPAVGGALGLLLSGQETTWEGAVGASVGGTTALLAHLAKAATRVGVNTSPEPFSNVLVSLVEDVAVASVVTVGLLFPLVGAGLALAALLGAIAVAVVVWRVSRLAVGTVRSRLRDARAPATPRGG